MSGKLDTAEDIINRLNDAVGYAMQYAEGNAISNIAHENAWNESTQAIRAIFSRLRDMEEREATLRRASGTLRENLQIVEERLSYLERRAIKNGQVEINFFPEERGNPILGEPEYHFLGGFQLGDDYSEPYYSSLNEAIDVAIKEDSHV